MRRAIAWAQAADLRLMLTEKEGKPANSPAIAVHTKADLGRREGRINVSSVTGEGIEKSPGLDRADRSRDHDRAAAPAATRERHRLALVSAADSLDEAAQRSSQPELAAASVQSAARELERIAGRIDAEAVLDRVFSSFCIGK